MANNTLPASPRTRQRVLLCVTVFAAAALGTLAPAYSELPDPAIMSQIEKASAMPAGDKQVSGIVVNEQKQPVAGILVALGWQWTLKQKNGSEQNGSRTVAQAITDAQGRFVFMKLSAGQFEYFVESPKDEYVVQAVPLAIKHSDTQKTLRIVLSRGAIVTGKVVDKKTGKPVSDAFIGAGVVPPGGNIAKWEEWQGNSFGKTDAQGRYQTRTMPGKVFVEVGRSVGSSASSQRILAAVCQVAAPAGKTVTAPTLSVLLLPMMVCVGPDGQPIASTTFRIIPDNLSKGGYITDATTDSTGAVVLGRTLDFPHLESGSFSILKDDLAGSGTFHWSPDGPLIVVVNGQESRYPDGVGTLKLLPGSASPVTGTVVSEDGTPIPNGLIWIEVFDPKSHSVVDQKTIKTNAAGVFRIPLDPNGQYQAYVRADGFNQVSVSDKRLTVMPGKPTDLGAIRLQRADGFISGTVADTAGKPIEGVLAYVQGDKTGISAAVTDAEGKFRIPNVIPGERLMLKLNRHGEAPDSGQALWQSNESMDIPDAYATPTPVEIVWRPK